MGNAVGARVGGSTPPDRARELTHWFCYQDPGVGDDPFDLHPSYAGGTRVEAAPARRRQFGAVRLAAGFAAAALRREVWAVPPWLELTRHRVLPPAPRGDTSPAEIADRLEQAILAAVGDEGTVAVTVSGGVDSAALLWMVGRICQRDGRRLVPIVLDMEDDQGGSPVTAAGLLLDAMGLGDPLRVVPADPLRWPEPAWVWHGPRFDAWPRYRRGIAEVAMTVGAGVLLHGTGADEVLAAPRHLLSRLLRHRGVTAARRYVRQRRAQGEAEIEHLAAALAGRIRGPRGGHFYWASTWPRLAADGGAPTLTAPMREAAVGWADAHRTESLRACRQQRMTWAEAAAMHALFPRDMLVPAGQVPERFPFLDNGFVRFAYNLPLEAKFGAGQPSAYLDHKHLVASLLPDQVLPLLPERRLRSYNGYERYWSAIPAAAPLSVELGLLAPDWASRCRDAFDKAVALSVEAWIRGALATGAAAVTDL